ncbi:MAG: hypothetical protein JWL77_657 [Chthonomonadaceae bacterium]|nr:hypothetical protein [Chthonomonadaceae bacterium]
MFENLVHSLRGGDTLATLTLILLGLIVLLLFGWLILMIRVQRLQRRIHNMTRGIEGNLEEMLRTHLDTVHTTSQRMDVLEQTVAVLQSQMPGCLRHAHLIRYDAFDDVGGEQSFSLALLDALGCGLVLTSVYSRNDVRVYAKSIRDGRASHALSQDEERLLRETVSR